MSDKETFASKSIPGNIRRDHGVAYTWTMRALLVIVDIFTGVVVNKSGPVSFIVKLLDDRTVRRHQYHVRARRAQHFPEREVCPRRIGKTHRWCRASDITRSVTAATNAASPFVYSSPRLARIFTRISLLCAGFAIFGTFNLP